MKSFRAEIISRTKKLKQFSAGIFFAADPRSPLRRLHKLVIKSQCGRIFGWSSKFLVGLPSSVIRFRSRWELPQAVRCRSCREEKQREGTTPGLAMPSASTTVDSALSSARRVRRRLNTRCTLSEERNAKAASRFLLEDRLLGNGTFGYGAPVACARLLC